MFRALISSLLLVSCLVGGLPSDAKMLQGSVQEEDLRLHQSGSGTGPGVPALAPPMRLSRAATGLQGSAVDSSAFGGSMLPGTAQTDTLKGMADQFAAPPKNFNIGADRGSKEMVLAWERWHHQLSEAIYTRWQRRVRTPGKATIRVDVTRDRRIRATILNTDGDGQFISSVMEAIEGLNGNQGLTFPAQSQRQDVSFEADYVAAQNVNPGFSWVKNDYEKVKQEY